MGGASLAAYSVRAKTQAFQRRVDAALRAIEAAERRAVVSVSFGKDSCAVAHLSARVLGRIDMMHMACAHELPGGERVREFMSSLGPIHELPPLNTLQESLEWLRVVGLPHERERSAHQRIVKSRKKDRGHDWAVEQGYATTILGMRADESSGRRWCFRKRGTTYQRPSGHWSCNPIAWWSSADVWSYLVSNGIPWHPLYDCESLGFTREILRNGGWLYTDGLARGWGAWLRKHYPEQWRRLVAEFPQVAAEY